MNRPKSAKSGTWRARQTRAGSILCVLFAGYLDRVARVRPNVHRPEIHRSPRFREARGAGQTWTDVDIMDRPRYRGWVAHQITIVSREPDPTLPLCTAQPCFKASQSIFRHRSSSHRHCLHCKLPGLAKLPRLKTQQRYGKRQPSATQFRQVRHLSLALHRFPAFPLLFHQRAVDIGLASTVRAWYQHPTPSVSILQLHHRRPCLSHHHCWEARRLRDLHGTQDDGRDPSPSRSRFSSRPSRHFSIFPPTTRLRSRRTTRRRS